VHPSLRRDIDTILAEKGAEALFLYSESFKNENMYYLTKLLAPDPFLYLKKVDGEPLIVARNIEGPRGLEESIVKDVRSYDDYNYLEIAGSASNPNHGLMKFITSVAKKELSVNTKIYVPPNFPVGLADVLRREGFTLIPLFDVIEKARETKDADEIQEVIEAQTVIENVADAVFDLIATADVAADGTLMVKNGGKTEPLSVRRLKSLFGCKFQEHGYLLEADMILTSGKRSGDIHSFGEPEDTLKADQPVIFDIFPRSLRNRYWADMTRTLVKGRASKKIKHMYETVLESQSAGIDALKAGVTGSELYAISCDGIGLEVHEGPRLNELNHLEVEESNVVTIEPGLYDPEIGGVRVEDILVVTGRGAKNITRMDKILEL
jgi:Xaa-Pro aminopeptidase